MSWNRAAALFHRRHSLQRLLVHGPVGHPSHLDGEDLVETAAMKQTLSAGTTRDGEEQGEAQPPSATSRPVPLRTAGLEDRDIDDCSHRQEPAV